MTLEEELRADRELVMRALGLVERISADPCEPLRDRLKPDWPKFGSEAKAYQEFLVGIPAGTGASQRLSSILSSFRILEGRGGFALEMLHSTLVQPSVWWNTEGHTLARRRLIALFEDVAEYLTERLQRECGVESVTRRVQGRARRARVITRREDLDAFQEKAMQLLSSRGEEPMKGPAIAAHCGVALGTAKRSLAELSRGGYLRSSRRGYVFVGWPGSSS